MTKQDTDSSLLDSAQAFLIEALRNLPGRLNFAIVHGVTAVELVLKERLARENPALILRNLDTPNPDSARSVSLSALPRRLANLGFPLEDSDARLVLRLAEWRNEIVHHMPSFETEAARQQVPKLLDFIATYLRTELDTPLEGFLPTGLYRAADGVLDDWRRAVAHAQAAAFAEDTEILEEACPYCGAAGVLCVRERDRIFCHLCGSDLYRSACEACERETLSSHRRAPWEDYCDRCMNELADRAGDQYISERLDLLRGK